MVEAASSETPVKEPVKAPGLESDDIWGDAPDPMDEMAGLTDAELQEKIRDMEAEMRRNRQQMTRL